MKFPSIIRKTPHIQLDKQSFAASMRTPYATVHCETPLRFRDHIEIDGDALMESRFSNALAASSFRPTGGTASAIIFSSSPVNRIVLERTAQRSCLKAVSMDLDAICLRLGNLMLPVPTLIIVDADVTGEARERLLEKVTERRDYDGCGMPLLISITASPLDTQSADAPVDAAISRPVTLDKLQPVIDRLLAKQGAPV